MRYRSLLLIGFLGMLCLAGYSQCIVTQDAQKRVITTCRYYDPKGGFLMNRPDRSQSVTQVTYLGSEYLTYPVWQPGTLETGDSKKPIPCLIAFNIATNVVKCRFEGDEQEYEVQPDAFTVNGISFISQVSVKGGQTSRAYYHVLYAGKTRVLKQFRCNLIAAKKEAYSLDDPFDGTFRHQKTYFIQRNNEKLRAVNLSRKSVLNVLDDPTSRLNQYLTQRKLDVFQLVNAVAYYDGFQE
ncbi:hypothetical protein [Larkinella humicola]|uniref:Uncharacterized protein n=1 Tax=Larkinella humicola TaxID=2607654 RepID=A0A5N1J7Y0_9BACT|nr:hypothetical protein [Larkinella humicola]KAA9347791.1 hypothetical protein F0P93_24485 [Larkinella humicola]